jgi:signal transduction histidine kinase
MIEIEKLTSMGKMAAGTAHHLNSPLAALLIRTELIRRHSTGPAFDDDLARLEEGLHFCRHFVQRLLDFTRVLPLEKAPQDLATVIESIAGFFQPAILSRRANLTVDTSEGRGQLVFADRNLLETLLLTLLSNALDAVPAGGEIRLSCRRRSPGTVGFTVCDNGCGISPAHLEHVFEPFFTTKEPGKGTGLGLAIARNVVMEHGGTIEIESRLGEGTIAIVDLPLAGVPETVGRAAS